MAGAFVLFYDFQRAVCGTAVFDIYFYLGVILPLNALKRAGKQRGAVVGGED